MTDITIRLDAALVAALKERVRFDRDADIAAFAGDALRVYAELGALCQSPGQLMWHPEGGTPRRVRFPFDDMVGARKAVQRTE